MRGSPLDFFALALVLVAAGPALAGSISFDELPATNDNERRLGEQYAGHGVHFHTNNDGSTWDGVSEGDPGTWGLEGTHGPAFAGFNGASYGLAATFDAPVAGVRLDVASSTGTTHLSDFTLEGYMNGTLVERTSVPLGEVGDWSTVRLHQEVDAVRWYGAGAGYHPFGVDNLRWRAPEPDFGVDLSVRRNAKSPLDLTRPGIVGAVVRGSAELDVLEIDDTTLALGPEGAGVVHRGMVRFIDVDGDGWTDLVGLYAAKETGLEPGDDTVCITGETWNGAVFEGCDGIWTASLD
jgi:hypothetical protein